jgi:hypothetical protein
LGASKLEGAAGTTTTLDHLVEIRHTLYYAI